MQLVVDHVFVLAFVARRRGLLLFLGRIADPDLAPARCRARHVFVTSAEELVADDQEGTTHGV
ncbi:MAG: hypothetical protein JWQ26_2491 [Modestobacter sp.]|nr:hypothetical protein [Modestobacter sp.]